MKKRRLNLFLFLCLIFFGRGSLLEAEEKPAYRPGPKDKCPVCGMFVAKYPDFIAVVTLKDGTHVFFDGVKDMMKYYLNMPRYAAGKTPTDIAAVFVTDYYTTNQIDGMKAYYVLGSDIFGPMGRELIPFEKKEDAAEFQKDHHGKAIFAFSDITDDIIKSLDKSQ